MKDRQKRAIGRFAGAIDELKDAGVIRSHRYLGDIAEFLCADLFGIVLSQNLREAGHDGMRGKLRVQVKYGGGKKTNVSLGNPDEYDEIYIVLGRESVVRMEGHDEDFVVYKLTPDEVRTKTKTRNGTYSCGRSLGNPVGVISMKDVDDAD